MVAPLMFVLCIVCKQVAVFCASSQNGEIGTTKLSTANAIRLQTELNDSYYWQNVLRSVPMIVSLMGELSSVSGKLNNLTSDQLNKALKGRSFVDAIREFVDKTIVAYKNTSSNMRGVADHMIHVAPGVSEILAMVKRNDSNLTKMAVQKMKQIHKDVTIAQTIAGSIKDDFTRIQTLLNNMVEPTIAQTENTKYTEQHASDQLRIYRINYETLKNESKRQLEMVQQKTEFYDQMKKLSSQANDNLPIMEMRTWFFQAHLGPKKTASQQALLIAQQIYNTWADYLYTIRKEHGFNGNTQFAVTEIANHAHYAAINDNYHSLQWKCMETLINQSKAIAWEIYNSSNTISETLITETIAPVQSKAAKIMIKLYGDAECEKKWNEAGDDVEKELADVGCNLRRAKKDKIEAIDQYNDMQQRMAAMVKEAISETNTIITAGALIKLLQSCEIVMGNLQVSWTNFDSLFRFLLAQLPTINKKLCQISKNSDMFGMFDKELHSLMLRWSKYVAVYANYITYYSTTYFHVYKNYLEGAFGTLKKLSLAVIELSNTDLPGKLLDKLRFECSNATVAINKIISTSEADSKATIQQCLDSIDKYFANKRKMKKREAERRERKHGNRYLSLYRT